MTMPWEAGWATLHWLRPWALWGLPVAFVLVLLRWLPMSRGRWRGVVAEHLLPHLLVGHRARWRLQPRDSLALTLAFGCLALAGPSWEQEPPYFSDDVAPLMIALDVSRSMDAVDVQPTRLLRAKVKIRELLARRGNAPTGLLVYAGTAHLVVPATTDAAVLLAYLEALDTRLMPVPGQAPAQALRLAQQWLPDSGVAGTALFIGADLPAADLPAFQQHAQQSRHRVVWLAMGHPEGGAIRAAENRYATDAHGQRLWARLDVEGLRAARDQAGLTLVATSPDDSDIRAVLGHIARWQRQAQADAAPPRWIDAGHWLLWPLLLVWVWHFRRGWAVRWTLSWALAWCLSALMAAPAAWADTGTRNGHWLDWWLTPDQQGRYWLERGQAREAASRFADPMWQGVAWAQAGEWALAAAAFAKVDSAAAWFNQAHMLARQGRWADAVKAYDEALRRAPGWSPAVADRARIAALLPRASRKSSDPAGEAAQPSPLDEEPDGAQRHPQPQREKRQRVPLTEDEMAGLWLKRIDTSPAGYLQRKFALQARERRSP